MSGMAIGGFTRGSCHCHSWGQDCLSIPYLRLCTDILGPKVKMLKKSFFIRILNKLSILYKISNFILIF